MNDADLLDQLIAVQEVLGHAAHGVPARRDAPARDPASRPGQEMLHLSADNREAVRWFIAHVRAHFAECPGVLEVIRRGDDPAHDVPS